MEIIIFGATGTVGKHLVSQSLEKGADVTVFTRNRKAFHSSDRLKIVTGDVFNPHDVLRAVEGKDVVFCALGDGRAGKVRAVGTRNIIEAMKKNRVNRLICQTTLGCGNSKNNLNFFWKYLMFGLILKKAFTDHELQEKYIFESDLDWTIIRPGAFTDGPLTKEFQYNFPPDKKDLKLNISRADLAWFMIEQASKDEFNRRAVSISY